MDVDIRNKLGRLPPDLDTIYAELYDVLSKKPGEMERKVFRNVVSWLLCAQMTLQTSAFLEAISVPTEGIETRTPILINGTSKRAKDSRTLSNPRHNPISKITVRIWL